MSEPTRVLVCSFEVIPGPSAVSRRLTEYLKALTPRFQVTVLSVKTPHHAHIEMYEGARLLRVPSSGDLEAQLTAFERAISRQLDSEDYALAHFTDPFSGHVLCEHKADGGHRAVYDATYFPSQRFPFAYPQTAEDRRFLNRLRRQELYCLLNADQVITGAPTAARYIQSLGVPAATVRVLRAPVTLAPFAADTVGAPDHSTLRVLYLGSQLSYQGLPTLLRAVRAAADEAPVTLVIAGPPHPDALPALQDLTAELNLDGHVRFAPPVAPSALPALLAQADVGVVPLEDMEHTRHGVMSLAKTSDYLAAGRPVVAADLPITRALLPEDCTRFFPAGDSDALAKQLVALAKEPTLRVKLGARARVEALRARDASVIRAQLLSCYAELGVSGEVQEGTPTEVVTRTGGVDMRVTQQLTPQAPLGPPGVAEPTVSMELLPEPPGDEPEEISNEHIVEADEPRAPPSLPPGRLDPWFALVAHGHCPPEGAQFARKPPPTTFPGRDT